MLLSWKINLNLNFAEKFISMVQINNNNNNNQDNIYGAFIMT